MLHTKKVGDLVYLTLHPTPRYKTKFFDGAKMMKCEDNKMEIDSEKRVVPAD